MRRQAANHHPARVTGDNSPAEEDQPLLLSAGTYSIEDQMDCRFLANRDLRGADLSRMHLCHAELSWANLAGADLSASDLEGASLCGALLNGASLRGANLSGADLTDADLQGADLAHICYTQATRWPYGFRPPMPPECGD